MHASFCREVIVLPGACVEVLTPTSTYRQFCHLYVLFVKISYQAIFCLQISYPAILFTMLTGFLNCGGFIIHALLPGTSKVFKLSGFCRMHTFMSFCWAHSKVCVSKNSYPKCPTSSVSTGHEASFCGCHGNTVFLAVEGEWSGHAHWHRHVANHVLTACTRHLHK